MKYAAISLLLLVGALRAQEEGKAAPDGAKLLNDLTVANAAKKPGDIGLLLDPIADFAKSNKDTKLAEGLAAELGTSYKLCKGNWGQLRKIMAALGELRAKKGLNVLKRVAFQRDPDSEDEATLQAAAIDAIGMYRDSRYISKLEDQCKSRNNVVAKAAYAAFRHYGPSRGKTRKKIAEILMKRMEMEYPSSGGQSGATVSAEKQERWRELSPVIVQTMQAICRMPTVNDVENWREWWKENKRHSDAWKDDKKS
jgi:hypothetical protein